MQLKLANVLSNGATAFVVLALGTVLSAAAAYFMSREIEHDASLKFEHAVAEAQEAIETRIRAYSDVLLGVRGLFIASDSVTRDEFQTYISSLDLNRRYPGIQVIHYAERVPAAQRQVFEAMVRNDRSVDSRGYPDFAVKPPGNRPEYFIVQYVEPMAGNEVAHGLDLGGDAVRLGVLERTRDSGQLTASGTIALANDPRRHPGFAMRLPVYRKGMPVATVDERREAFSGMVSTSFVVIELMRGVLSEQFLRTTHVRIHDAGFLDSARGLQQPSAENLMFDSDRLFSADSRRDISSGSKFANLASTEGLEVGGRRWDLHFSAREGLIAPSERLLPWATFLVGALISLLLFGLIRSLATSGRRAIKLAARITEDLRESEASLVEAQRMTQQLIEVLPNPIFFKGTDGRCLGVNRAWEKFFGVPRETIIGKTVHDLYPNDREVADRRHALDQELWDRPGAQTFEASITTPDGKRHDTIHYRATFTRADDSVAGLVGTIIDITERKQADAARNQLAAIVEHADAAIFSRTLDGTIQSWNAGAEKMLGYTAAEAIGKPADFTLPSGRSPNLKRNNESLLRGEVVSRESDRMTRDGRVINVLTSHSPIRDGAGNIVGASVILQDITALKQAQAAVKESEERFRATFDQAAVGIAHFDLQHRNIKANRRYGEIVGYSPDELLGKPPGFLNHPDDAGMGSEQRSQLLSGAIDHFSQDKRYLRKDGTVIWVRRTESLARDGAGAPRYFLRVIEDITDRKGTAERYRATFDNAPVGIMHTAIEDDRILHANSKLCDMLGYTQEDLAHMMTDQFIHPDYVGSDQPKYRERMLKGEIHTFSSERLYRRKDGADLWVNRTVSLARDTGLRPLYFIRVIEDISERKQAEKRMAMEHAVTRVLADAQTLAEAIPKIIQTICETLAWHCGARWARDEESGLMRCIECWGVDSPEIQEFMTANSKRTVKEDESSGEGLVRQAVRTGKPIWVADLSHAGGFRRAALVARANLHGAFCFPLLVGNEVLGVMEFFHRDVREPDDMLIHAAQSIGSQIGQYMVRQQVEERVRHLAHYDELTGLPNRTMFNDRLRHALTRARRAKRSLVVLFIDLDRFKNINDTLGHDAGDHVLKDVAHRLRDCLRESDTLGRLGGDEFVVLIEEPPRPVNAAVVAQKILAALGSPFLVQAQEFHITASIGISGYPDDGADMQALMKNADIAMYRAKEQGRNNFQFYSAQINVHSIERFTLESGLRRALERNEFLLHYQPKLDIGSGRITGVEALLRWQQPVKGLIPPAQFIQLAEETGLIVPIGEWVLKTACAQNKAWQLEGWAPVRVAVNLSPRQFAHENLLADVARVLEQTGLDPAFLEFEITESMVMNNPEHAIVLLNRLKALGIHLAIDDFGTGYSSLSYLKRFPLDTLKIDQTFIRDLPGDGDDAAITQAIIAMAHSLRLSVVAEGVETAEQLNFLRHYKCDEIQGYYFSRPQPAADIAPLLRDNAAVGTILQPEQRILKFSAR